MWSWSLWDVDANAATTQLSSLANDPDYIGSRVVDAKGKLFVRHGEVAEQANSITYKADIVGTEGGRTQVLGTVEVRLSTQRAKTVTKARTEAIAII